MDNSELLEIKRRRLRVLEEQEAKFGYYCPPHIRLEMQDLRKEIEQIERDNSSTGQTQSSPVDLDSTARGGGQTMFSGKGSNWPGKPFVLVAPAALIIFIVLIWFVYKDRPTPPPKNFLYSVRVKDEVTTENIPFRPVTVEVAGRKFDAATDVDGLARISIPEEFKGKPGKIIIDIDGYKYKESNIDVNNTGVSEPILMEPLQE